MTSAVEFVHADALVYLPINDLAGLIQAHTQAAPDGGSLLWVCQK